MADKYGALSSATTVLTTELNSLANGALSSVGSTVSNDGASERFPRCMVEVYIAAQGSSRAAGAYLGVYFVPSIDGTNFGDTNDETAENYLVASVSVDDGATAARRIVIDNVRMPPSDFKPALRNGTGQALASSANTVKIAQYTRENV